MDGSSDEKKHVNDNENLCPDRPDDLQNIPMGQRIRIILVPFDQNLLNYPLFLADFTEISILTLEKSDAIQKNINTKFIDIQILIVITPTQQTNAIVYNHQSNRNNQSS